MGASINRIYWMIAGLIAAAVIISPVALPGQTERQEMLYQADRFEDAIEVIERADRENLSLADIALQARIYYGAGQLDTAIEIFKQLDTTENLQEEGLETLAYYYGENQQFKEKYLTLARLADDHLNATDSRQALGYFEAMGMGDAQIHMLEAMHKNGYASLKEQIKLARIYRYQGRSEEALNIFEDLLLKDPAKAAVHDMKTLVRLMQHVGRAEQVTPTLERWMAGELEQRELRDRLGYLMELERFELVVGQTEGRRKVDRHMGEFYQASLYKLKDSSDIYKQAYFNLLLEQLNETDQPNRQARLLYDLYALGETDPVTNQIKASGYDNPGVFNEIYYSRLQKEGRRTELADFLLADFEALDPFDAKRMKIADRISSLKRYRQAETAYAALVDTHGPSSPAMQGLLYTWKKLGRGPQIQWIGWRMINSDAEKYPVWEKMFLQTEQPTELLNWLESNGSTRANANRLLETKVQLALWEQDNPRLEALMNEAVFNLPLTHAKSIEYLEASCANGYMRAAMSIVGRLDSINRLPLSGHLCGARFASDLDEHQAAAYHYSIVRNEAPVLSLDDIMRYAEARRVTLGADAAHSLYAEALTLLPALEIASAEENMTRGYLLMELSDRRNAGLAFEAVLRSGEGDIDEIALRKQLMEIYTHLGDYQKVLEFSCRDGSC